MNDKSIVSSYLTTLRTITQLKHEELIELFKQLKAATGREHKMIKNKIIECNLRLVVSMAKKYRAHSMAIEDLIQEGNIGLMKAVDKFDHERGFHFSTYARWWIKQAIDQHILKSKRMIRLPAHAASMQRRILQTAEDYRKEMGCDPTPEEIVALLKDASETVIRATIYSSKAVVSLQEPAANHGYAKSSNHEWTIQDNVMDENVDSNPFHKLFNSELFSTVKAVFDMLSSKEAAILRMRYAITEDGTNHEKYPITMDEAVALKNGIGLCDDEAAKE